jgi:hypothetical protein
MTAHAQFDLTGTFDDLCSKIDDFDRGRVKTHFKSLLIFGDDGHIIEADVDDTGNVAGYVMY